MSNLKSATLFTVFGLLLASLTGSPMAAPDKALGMALMFAHVGVSGDTVGSAGVVGSQPLNDGAHRLDFARSVSGCGRLVSITDSSAGMAQSVPTGNANRIVVHTFDTTGAPATRGFTAIVFCPR